MTTTISYPCHFPTIREQVRLDVQQRNGVFAAKRRVAPTWESSEGTTVFRRAAGRGWPPGRIAAATALGDGWPARLGAQSERRRRSYESRSARKLRPPASLTDSGGSGLDETSTTAESGRHPTGRIVSTDGRTEDGPAAGDLVRRWRATDILRRTALACLPRTC